MKIITTFWVYCKILSLLALICCSSQNKKIKVSQAYYRTFTTQNEKGYDLFFTVNSVHALPKYIVINKIRQNVFPDDQLKNNKYHFRILSESRLIHGFRAEISGKENGIGFGTGAGEDFIPVKFRVRR